MRHPERIEVASRWTAALSRKGVTPLTALAEVLDEDVRTLNLAGKESVLNWFRTWNGMPMFRTGTWRDPVVAGDVVTFVCDFDPRAAFHGATIKVTVGESGLITRSETVMSPAPEPLGSVILRTWGPRAGLDRLPEHLASTYGVQPNKTTALDNGVLRVDLAKGGPWVVRVFPADRPVAHVARDAAVLRFLESQEFPSERCVADVSTFEGQGVLVTGFLKGSKPKPTKSLQSKVGGLLGLLHSLPVPKGLRHAAGGLHLYTMDATVPNEIRTARESLQAATFRGKDKKWDVLMQGLDSAPDFSTLPKALIHPDPAAVNMIVSGGEPVLIDWAGAGYGPRVLGLGLLLVACTEGKTFNRDWTDAVMGAYTEHVKLKPAELEVLEAVVSHRLLIHEVYSWCVGMARERKPSSRKEWPHNNEGIAQMAGHIRQTWC
ncbi:MAG TPA: phosphotransferase [Actinomycetota bacterium]|nr:phosphotransferase [Actinomycetota bacterium]